MRPLRAPLDRYKQGRPDGAVHTTAKSPHTRYRLVLRLSRITKGTLKESRTSRWKTGRCLVDGNVDRGEPHTVDADGGVRAPRCGRGRPRTTMRTGASAHHDADGGVRAPRCGRGRPRTTMRTGASAHHDADGGVRAPALREAVEDFAEGAYHGLDLLARDDQRWCERDDVRRGSDQQAALEGVREGLADAGAGGAGSRC